MCTGFHDYWRVPYDLVERSSKDDCEYTFEKPEPLHDRSARQSIFRRLLNNDGNQKPTRVKHSFRIKSLDIYTLQPSLPIKVEAPNEKILENARQNFIIIDVQIDWNAEVKRRNVERRKRSISISVSISVGLMLGDRDTFTLDDWDTKEVISGPLVQCSYTKINILQNRSLFRISSQEKKISHPPNNSSLLLLINLVYLFIVDLFVSVEMSRSFD